MNSVNLTAFGAGGDGNLSYVWEDENGNNLWGWMGSLWYDGMWEGDGLVSVTVTDGCGLTATDTLTVEFPPVTFSVPDTVYANCVDPITLTPIVTTGVEHTPMPSMILMETFSVMHFPLLIHTPKRLLL